MNSSHRRLDAAIAAAPVVAILRGLSLSDALPVVQALYDAGIRIAEVPLNSPQPFDTIGLLIAHFGSRMVIGAGTVTDVAQVDQLAACGAILCVAPNTNLDVIRAALLLGMVPMPGCQTATEAFAAWSAGASYLKLFPAAGRNQDVAALRTVLPKGALLVAVGGITPRDVPAMFGCGAVAFGAGSDLYRPGASITAVRERAQTWIDACARARVMPQVAVACQPGASIGEGPVWLAETETLMWVDPVQQKLLSFDSRHDTTKEQQLCASVSSIVVLPSGQLAGCLEDRLCLLDCDQGHLSPGPAVPLEAGCRFNDMAADARGGLWVGAMHKGLLATRGAIYYTPDYNTACIQVVTGLGVPNGMVFDRDGRTLYLIDTLARNLLAFPANIESGQLGEPRIVTDFMGLPGKPDGMTMASDGSLWVAMWGGGCVVQIGADGAAQQIIAVPAPHVSSLCFGADGRLWVTSSRMRLSQAQLAEAPNSGALFVIGFPGQDKPSGAT